MSCLYNQINILFNNYFSIFKYTNDLKFGRATFHKSFDFSNVALFADRACIDEEITRFKSHIAQLISTLDLSEPEPDLLREYIDTIKNNQNVSQEDLDLDKMAERLEQTNPELAKILFSASNLTGQGMAADIVVEIGEWLFSENEIRSWNVLKKYVQPGSYSANSKKKESDDKAFSYKATSEVFNSDLKSITRVEGKEEVSGIKSLTNNIAKTDVDEAKAMGDKCDVIKAIEQLISCMKERNAAVASVSRRLPKRSMSDIRGILSGGDAISAESARYAERVEKCIETLNVSFLKMEKEFSNDSTVQINAIREKRYNSIKPHIIELFEILRDSPDKIRHRVENVIPIQLARYLVNCDNRIRKKYYLLPSFGFEL